MSKGADKHGFQTTNNYHCSRGRTMTDYQKYINALRKCAKEHKNDRTSFGHIRVSDLCRDTANLLEELEQEPRWFSVSERMPEEDTDVLVTLKCGLIGIMQKKLADDDNGEPCYIWQDFEGEEHEVIAWMPLPEAYREVKV